MFQIYELFCQTSNNVFLCKTWDGNSNGHRSNIWNIFWVGWKIANSVTIICIIRLWLSASKCFQKWQRLRQFKDPPTCRCQLPRSNQPICWMFETITATIVSFFVIQQGFILSMDQTCWTASLFPPTPPRRINTTTNLSKHQQTIRGQPNKLI